MKLEVNLITPLELNELEIKKLKSILNQLINSNINLTDAEFTDEFLDNWSVDSSDPDSVLLDALIKKYRGRTFTVIYSHGDYFILEDNNVVLPPDSFNYINYCKNCCQAIGEECGLNGGSIYDDSLACENYCE